MNPGRITVDQVARWLEERLTQKGYDEVNFIAMELAAAILPLVQTAGSYVVAVDTGTLTMGKTLDLAFEFETALDKIRGDCVTPHDVRGQG